MNFLLSGVVILSGGLDADAAEAALASGSADLVSFERPLIANPDLVGRMLRRAPLAPADPSTFYTSGATDYVDYPALASGFADYGSASTAP